MEHLSEEMRKRLEVYEPLPKHDPVNNPKHYDLFPGEQSIDLIEKCLSPEEFRGFLKGNCLKYRIRAGNKDDLQQDINKANWYQNKLWTQPGFVAAQSMANAETGLQDDDENRMDVIGQNGNDGIHYRNS